MNRQRQWCQGSGTRHGVDRCGQIDVSRCRSTKPPACPAHKEGLVAERQALARCPAQWNRLCRWEGFAEPFSKGGGRSGARRSRLSGHVLAIPNPASQRFIIGSVQTSSRSNRAVTSSGPFNCILRPIGGQHSNHFAGAHFFIASDVPSKGIGEINFHSFLFAIVVIATRGAATSAHEFEGVNRLPAELERQTARN